MSQQFPQYPAPQPPKKSHTLRTVLIVVAATFCVMTAGIVGCVAIVGTAVDETTDSPVSVETTTPVVQPSTPAVTEGVPETTEPPATEEPPEESSDSTTIGKSTTYESGLVVSVTAAKVFSPGDYASGLTTGHKAVKVTVTVTNGTGSTVDLSLVQVGLHYGKDGAPAEAVYADGVGGMFPFEGSLPNGKKKSAYAAFSVPKAGLSLIVVEVTPDSAVSSFFFGKATAK